MADKAYGYCGTNKCKREVLTSADIADVVRKSDLGSFLMRKVISKTYQLDGIDASSTFECATETIDITESGYTPIALDLITNSNNTFAQSKGVSNIYFNGSYVRSEASIRIIKTSKDSVFFIVKFDVLYMKNME